jgi:hypothetical protein
MEKRFIKIRDHYVNLYAISFAQSTDDGGLAVTVMNRDQPLRLSRDEAQEFLAVLSRFTIPSRSR